MDKLLIYNNINEIDFRKLEKGYDLIITSYSEAAKVLEKKSNIKVISIGKVLENLFDTWNDRELDYSNIVQIRKVLDESKYFSAEIVDSFTKSIDYIYDTLKEAKELRITIEEYQSQENTLEENLLLKIMKSIYNQDSFTDFDLSLFNYENDIETFKRDVEDVLNIDTSYDKFFKNKKILIQGFYYITPIQEIVFSFFRKSGIIIEPIICYDNRYKAVNKIVDNTFENYQKKKLTENNQKDLVYISDIYAGILDGKEANSSNIMDIDNLNFRHYKNLNIYNKDLIRLLYDNSVEQKDESLKLYAVNRNNLLNRISIFRGDLEEPDKLSIKHYPLGIFLKEVYGTWNSKNNSVCLNMELLSRIFECNILQINDKNRTCEYIDDLNKMSVYFDDCITIEEWITRIEELINTKSNMNIDSKNKILIDYYGPFSIKQSRVESIKSFLVELKNMTDTIFFDKKGNVDTLIIIHLNNLSDIMQKNTEVDDEDNQSLEYQLLKKINKILENKKDKILSSARNEYLFKALNLYISDVNKSKKSEKRKVDIYHLDSIEIMDKNVEEVNIYDFDRNYFPQTKFKDLLFINKDKLQKIKDNREDGSLEKNIIDRYIKLIDSNELIGRYVFWLMLSNINIKKNIYRLIEDDTDNKHFYQYLLENILHKNSIEVLSEVDRKNIDINIDFNRYKKNNKKSAVDAKAKYLYMYCPLRAFFTRINDGRELYVEKLSVEHFIPSAISNIYIKNNNAINILSSFSQYSNVMLERLKGITIHNIRNYDNTEGCFWLPNTLKIKNQKNRKYENIENLYAYYRYRNIDVNLGILPKPNNGKNTCTYCSFKYICVDKDLNNNNYPNSFWIRSKENEEYLNLAKSMMNR